MQFDALSGLPALTTAWLKTRRKGGGPGGDGESVEAFERAAEARLARLSQELRAGYYRPGPLRRLDLPKPTGGSRRLAIPCVVDRVVQRSAADLLAALLEPQFENDSFAYRPGRSVRQAVDRVAALRRQGFTHVVDGDIRAYFDSVPHGPLLEKLAAHGAENRVVELVALWLDGAFPEGRGLPQGSPVSPVLANLYLDALDEAFGERKSPVRIVRFADDFVLLARSRLAAEGAMARARDMLAEHGLELHPEKTRLVRFEDAFTFLGRKFVRSLVVEIDAEDGDTVPHVAPTAPEPPGAPAGTGADPRWTLIPAPRPRRTDPLPEAMDGDRDSEDFAAGLAPLYVLEPGRILTPEGEGFAVHEGARCLLRVPAALVGRIDLGAGVEASDAALRLAADHEIPVTLLDGAFRPQSVLLPAIRGDAGLHLAQSRLALDPALQGPQAGAFAGGRIRGMHALLKRLNRRRNLPDVDAAGDRLKRGWRKAEMFADLAVAREAEAEMARLYWPLLAQCLEHGFSLARRRPDTASREPFNLVLDFTAHLLTRDMQAAVLRARLHPGFGVLHASGDRRDACVYDLIEAFRAPLAESLAVELINNRYLSNDDFAPAEEGLRMGAAAARKVVQLHEARLARAVLNPRAGRRTSWRNLLLAEARAYARAAERGEIFKPYTPDW
jgi:CRISPR-associated protein Cas1